MNQIEQNIIHSFRLVKSDIIKLQDEIVQLSQTQERLMEVIDDLKGKVAKSQKPQVKKVPARAQKTVVRTVTKRAHKEYVAKRGGKKFHVESCPYAKNIKPKNKIKFHSTTKARNEGLRPCSCIR